MDVPGGDNPVDSDNLLKIIKIFIREVKNEERLDQRVSGYFTACKRLPFLSAACCREEGGGYRAVAHASEGG